MIFNQELPRTNITLDTIQKDKITLNYGAIGFGAFSVACIGVALAVGHSLDVSRLKEGVDAGKQSLQYGLIAISLVGGLISSVGSYLSIELKNKIKFIEKGLLHDNKMKSIQQDIGAIALISSVDADLLSKRLTSITQNRREYVSNAAVISEKPFFERLSGWSKLEESVRGLLNGDAQLNERLGAAKEFFSGMIDSSTAGEKIREKAASFVEKLKNIDSLAHTSTVTQCLLAAQDIMRGGTPDNPFAFLQARHLELRFARDCERVDAGVREAIENARKSGQEEGQAAGETSGLVMGGVIGYFIGHNRK